MYEKKIKNKTNGKKLDVKNTQGHIVPGCNKGMWHYFNDLSVRCGI